MPGEVRQLAAGERGDAFVHNGVGAGQAKLEAAGDLLVPLRGGQLRLALDGVAGFGPVVVVQSVVAAHGYLRNDGPTASGRATALSRVFIPPWSGSTSAASRSSATR